MEKYKKRIYNIAQNQRSIALCKNKNLLTFLIKKYKIHL